MSVSLAGCLGSKPTAYAVDVLKQCGLGDPPVYATKIANHLGFEVKQFTQSQVDTFEEMDSQGDGISETLEIANAMLELRMNKAPRIWVYGALSRPRKRMSVFHEIGHAILPWHSELNYFCTTTEVGGGAHKRAEQEAFAAATELMMPTDLFIPEAQGSSVGFATIEALADRYEVSLEATAIRYAKTHQGVVAILRIVPTADTLSHPVQVKYCFGSRHFPTFVPSGTLLGHDNPICEAWRREESRTEVPSWTLGSSKTATYQAECRPFGTDEMLVLLWHRYEQQTLHFHMEDS